MTQVMQQPVKELEPRQEVEQTWFGLNAEQWVKSITILGLMTALFWPNLRRLWLKVNPFFGEPNWGHSIVVPAIGLYYLYLNREQLLKPRQAGKASSLGLGLGFWVMLQVVLGGILFVGMVLKPEWTDYYTVGGGVFSLLSLIGCLLAGKVSTLGRLVSGAVGCSAWWFGIVVTLLGILLYAWAIYPGQNDFLKDVAMPVTLFGVAVLVGGWVFARVTWFPIFFLICAFPWPGLFYSKVAMPLQKLAATSAVFTLQVTGVDAEKDGTKIVIGTDKDQRVLNVAEACAGMRSLMTFITVAGAVGFLSNRPMWQKLAILASGVPIAIFCNMMRVTGQGLLDYYVSHELSQSFAHQFVGMVMLIPAFFLILLVGWVLDQMFVDDTPTKAVKVRVANRGGR